MRLKEVSIHIISWLAFSLIVFYWQTNMFEDSDALIQTARMISVGMALFYLNLYVLLPRFFESNQFIKYSLSVLVILAVAYFLFFLTNDLSPRPEMRIPRGMKEGVEMRDRPPMPPRNMSRMVIFTIINGIPMFHCVKCDCKVEDHTTGTHGKWKAAKANKAEFDITKSSPNSPLAKAIVAFGQAGSSNSSSSSSEGEDSSSSEGALTKATIEERLSKMETNMTDSNHVQLVGVMRKALLKD